MTLESVMIEVAHKDKMHDGTEARSVLLEILHRNFSEDPEGVWDVLSEALNDMRPDPLQTLAERLLRSGAVVDEDTLLSEAWPILISHVIV